MIDAFLEKLMTKINTILQTYYEEAPDETSYPYGVIPSLSINSLNYGYQCLFDIEVYINELSNQNVEEICDSLRNGLDGFFCLDKDVGFHLNFENQYLGKMTEQDSKMRRVTFIARIF